MSELNDSFVLISKDDANDEETQLSFAPAEKSKRNRVPPSRYGVEENEVNDDEYFNEILIQTSMPSTFENVDDSVQSCSSCSGASDESDSTESETDTLGKQPGKRKKLNAPQPQTQAQVQTQIESENQQTTHPCDSDENDDTIFESIVEIANAAKDRSDKNQSDNEDAQQTSENEQLNGQDRLSPGEKILYRMICNLSKEVKVLNKTVTLMEVKQSSVYDMSEKIGIVRMDLTNLKHLGLPLKSEETIKKFEADLDKDDFSAKMYDTLKIIGTETGNACGDEVVIEICRILFDGNLLANMSWTGKSNAQKVRKIPFNMLINIRALIFKLSHAAAANYTKKQCEKVIIYKVLKYAYKQALPEKVIAIGTELEKIVSSGTNSKTLSPTETEPNNHPLTGTSNLFQRPNQRIASVDNFDRQQRNHFSNGQYGPLSSSHMVTGQMTSQSGLLQAPLSHMMGTMPSHMMNMNPIPQIMMHPQSTNSQTQQMLGPSQMTSTQNCVPLNSEWRGNNGWSA